MTGRLLTIATVLTLSASLAYADQARQRWPGSSQGSSSGQSSGGGQAAPAPAPAPARAEPRSAPPPPAPRQEAPRTSSGGSQIERWGTPRAERAESAPPPAPRSGGSSQIQRWGMTRQERQEASPTRVEPEPRASVGLSRVPREQATPLPSNSAAPVITGGGAMSRSAAPDGGQRVAQPRQRYPRPEDQQQGSGVAVPRGSVSQPQRPSGGSIVYGGRPTTRVYNNYYYYPRNSYPYGYGSYGLGYFYYDPYAWYDNYYYDPYYPTYASPGYYGGGVYQYRYGYPTGEVRLQVRPRHAEVYVDGYYAGRVDDFDGFLQGLRIEEGPHTIEIVAPGYETLVFNVRIIAGRKIDYRGDLRIYRP